MARGRRGQSAAATRYVQRGPRAGVLVARSAISAADMSDCAEFSGFRRMARLSAGQIRSMGNIRHSDADLRGETLTLV